VPGILLILDNPTLRGEWFRVLSSKHRVYTLDRFDQQKIQLREKDFSLLVLDAQFIDADIATLEHIKDLHEKTVIAGCQWPEEKQVAALVTGASGYFESDIPEAALLKAVECVIEGDIWIKRQLIPKVLDTLVSAKNRKKIEQQERSIDRDEILGTLSKREADVAKMISLGESNKNIADKLFISERTVKAHLTSIFKKLNIPDRLHLAVLLKEIT